MKKALLVLAFAAVMVVAVVPSAFALHGGYTTTGLSCSECHSVHDASGNALFISGTSSVSTTFGAALTLSGSSTAQNLCEYCHVYGTTRPVYQTGYTKVVSGASSMHQIGATVIKDGSVTAQAQLDADNIAGLTCLDCHNALPHSAGYDRTNGWKSGTHRIYTQDPDINSFCGRCHDDNSDATRLANRETHPLRAYTTNYQTTMYGQKQIAWNDSSTCFKCHLATNWHASGSVTTTGAQDVAFTTYAAGKAYNGTYPGEVADGECLSCHQDGTGTLGVSKTW